LRDIGGENQMTTIKITARDSSTAMEEVSKKLGADAFILATTSHEGGVEIEATNDPEELKKFSNKPRKKFSNLMRKELGNVATFPISKNNFNELRSLPQSNKIIPNLAQSDLSVLNSNISSLRDEIRGMYITGSEGLGVELGESTFVKLQQAGFDTEVIKALSPAFSGLSIERGRIAFMKTLAASLTLEEPLRKFNRITFVNGFSGVGKTTLTAKLSAAQQENVTDNIVLAKLGYKSDPPDESLRYHARMLNKPVIRLNPENFIETLVSTKGQMLIDVSLDATDFVRLILGAVDFLSRDEITSIVAVPSGSNNAFINRQASLFEDLEPYIILTKLDECDISSNEMSEIFKNGIKISHLTGSKSIVDSLSCCSSEILTQYLIENC